MDSPTTPRTQDSWIALLKRCPKTKKPAPFISAAGKRLIQMDLPLARREPSPTDGRRDHSSSARPLPRTQRLEHLPATLGLCSTSRPRLARYTHRQRIHPMDRSWSKNIAITPNLNKLDAP